MKYAISGAALIVAGACSTAIETPKMDAAPSSETVDAKSTIKGVRYVMSTVSDIDRTIGFYQTSVDYEVVKRYRIDSAAFDPALLDGASGKAEVALIKTPTVYLKLVDFDLENDTPGSTGSVIGPGYTHICFQSRKDNSAYTKFRRAGLAMITRGDGPADRGYGTSYAYGTDLDGTMIELEVQDETKRSEDAWVGHVANATPDLERMLAFYNVLLGYPAYRRAELADSDWADSVVDIDGLVMKGGWLVTANLGLEFWQFDTPQTPYRAAPATLDTIGYSAVAFEVSDLDADISRLTQSGVKFAGNPVMEEGWKVAYGYDPDGNLFSLQQNVRANSSESINGMLWIDPSSF